jgi:hypothetical protein
MDEIFRTGLCSNSIRMMKDGMQWRRWRLGGYHSSPMTERVPCVSATHSSNSLIMSVSIYTEFH